MDDIDHRTHHGGRFGFETVDVGHAAALDAFLSRDHGRRRRVLRGVNRSALRDVADVAKAVDVDGGDPFWADPGKGWGVAVGVLNYHWSIVHEFSVVRPSRRSQTGAWSSRSIINAITVPMSGEYPRRCSRV